MIRILHTSDVQLDATLGFLGERAAEHRRQLLATFCSILDLAAKEKFDLVAVAGDLFDTPTPTEYTLVAAQRACAGCPVPIAILPGNHDHYGNGSVYRDSRWPGNVHIMDGQPWQPENLDLLVHGHPLGSALDGNPLKDVARNGGCQFEIALVHGNIERGDIANGTRKIPLADLEATGMDYVAMGDWHKPGDYSQGDVTAWYCGAPEPTALAQTESGYVLDVRLGASRPTVTPVRVAAMRAEEMALDITGLGAGDVLDRILERADASLMLTVRLWGAASPGELLDVETMTCELAPSFFYVRISDDSQLLEVSLEEMEREGSPLRSNYVRLMHERMQDAVNDAERQRLERSLMLGLALLDGKRVLS